MKRYTLNMEPPVGKQRFTARQPWDLASEELAGEEAITYNRQDPKDLQDGAQQQFKDDVDINVMMKRFGVTDGAVPPAATDARYFGDFTGAPDFRTALDTTREALERFNALPAQLRKRFGNDPLELFNFVHDPANFDESVKLGLLHQEAPIPPAAPPADKKETP